MNEWHRLLKVKMWKKGKGVAWRRINKINLKLLKKVTASHSDKTSWLFIYNNRKDTKKNNLQTFATAYKWYSTCSSGDYSDIASFVVSVAWETVTSILVHVDFAIQVTFEFLRQVFHSFFWFRKSNSWPSLRCTTRVPFRCEQYPEHIPRTLCSFVAGWRRLCRVASCFASPPTPSDAFLSCQVAENIPTFLLDT